MESPRPANAQALSRIRKNRDDLGRNDPLWAILSQRDTRRVGWAPG